MPISGGFSMLHGLNLQVPSYDTVAGMAVYRRAALPRVPYDSLPWPPPYRRKLHTTPRPPAMAPNSA